MSFRLKKILVVLGFLIVVTGIGYLLYITFFRGPVAPPSTSPAISDQQPGSTLPGSGAAGDRPVEVPPTTGTTGGILPGATTVAAGGLTQVTKLTLTSVIDPKLSGDGSTLSYYDPHDGKFYRVDADGNILSILPTAFPNADNVLWNPDTNKAILEFPDGANVTVDLQTGKTSTLPTHWEDFQFAPNSSDQIIAKSVGADPGNRWLVIAQSDGSQAQTIAALGNNASKVDVSWSPNDQVVAFSDTGALVSGFGRKQILPIGKNQENFPGLVIEGFSFEPLWSNDGSQILYSTNGPTSNYQPQLWLVDGTSQTLGDNRRSLAINTWADKCTYSDATTAYCAVPKNLPPGSGLQRSLAFGLPDVVYRVDTRTGVALPIAEPEDGPSMSNLQVSDDGSILFYQDDKSGTLQRLRLR
ncbi:hypothetical protein COV06_04445 [Candidatus Uhrbacteria bacterium CG10_big_fil_rev_8_21_14_0_10_50_16]|uniref:Dipeptidylpeptidase IV N-terminal domain-containing protein n=1 Tax=Candidatus Uhrbacteria bacterium CG10_big_fil_rev_8_21_14_0_10_50_16 TaxID=1975039 RepID=A0A2H0RL79_9BACT|nr:MAG: hypothetical protein COV06_04445 [Candidatus Uhrbacteria bacterium CG10_big_fil_rev_8_21_14_0_10_50_16]